MFTKVDFESVCNGKAWGGLMFQDRFHPVLRYEVKLAGLASGFMGSLAFEAYYSSVVSMEDDIGQSTS